MTELVEQNKLILTDRYKTNIITIPFEQFVLNPSPFMEIITSTLKTKAVKLTNKVMKKQKIPRKMIGAGLDLEIYKRCGWEPPKSNDEKEEMKIKREYARQSLNSKSLETLDQLSSNYERKFLANIL